MKLDMNIMNSPHGSFTFFNGLLCVPIRVEYLGTAFPLIYHEIMSKLRQNALIEDLTSTQCRDSCLSTNYYDEWTSFAKLAMGTHIPDFDCLKHYLGVPHVGDHVVLIVMHGLHLQRNRRKSAIQKIYDGRGNFNDGCVASGARLLRRLRCSTLTTGPS